MSHGEVMHAIEQACSEYFSSSKLRGISADPAIKDPAQTISRNVGCDFLTTGWALFTKVNMPNPVAVSK